MALPFDLRLCAAAADDSGGEPGSPSRPDGAARRPSRAVVLPAGLIERIQQHDVEALQELVRLAYGEMVRFAKTIVGSRDAAEDVVQEIFTILWDRGDRWVPSGDPVAYLFASVRNQALSEIRRRDRAERRGQRAHAYLHPDAGASGDVDPTDLLEQVVTSEADAIRIRTIGVVLASLTERQRTAYDLRYRRGLTAPAIGHVLGITTKSAEQLTSRVTQVVWERVRQALAKAE